MQQFRLSLLPSLRRHTAHSTCTTQIRPFGSLLLWPLLTSLPTSLRLTASVASRHRQGSPQVSHMRFASYLLNLRRPFPYRYWVNRSWTALPESSPRIQFLFVRLTLCYRLPSSVRYLPDSAESLVLPSIGRTVDFHHQTHVRCWAHRKNRRTR